jgi:hypothetical protein
MTKKRQADAADDQVDAVDEDEDLDTMLGGGDEVQQAKEWFRREVRTRGLKVALNALIDVAADSKAAAPARATAGTSIMRAAGMFGKAEEQALEAKPLDQMTQDEMTRELAKLRAGRLRNERIIRRGAEHDKEDDGNVFD